MSAESLIAKTAASVSADNSGLLQTLQGHVEDIRALLQCGICVRPLYEPYTLACGHTFCYGCLTSWFASGRSHKTCPDCRAQVKIQPAPAYLVRTLVQIFTSRAELLDKDETTAEHGRNQREEAEKLEADKTNENPRNGGLFQGFFKPKLHPPGPIIDAEDGVARCPHCAWELEEDSCLNCGYHVDDDSEGSDFTDDFSDMTDDIDGDMDEDIDDDDFEHHHQSAAWRDPYSGSWAYPRPGDHMRFAEQYFVPGPHVHFHPSHHHHHHHQHGFDWDPFAMGGAPALSSIGSVDQMSEGEGESISEDEENSEDEDEDEEMGSFIDDEEVDSGTDRSTVVGDHSYTNYYDFTNDSSQIPATHDGVEYMGTSSQSYDGSEHYYTGEHDEEGEEEEEEESGDDEEEVEEDEESGSEEAEDDDDEDEDEGPIRAATRRRPQPPPQPQLLRRRQQQQNTLQPSPYSPAAQLSFLAGNNPRRRPHPSSAQRRATATAAGTSASNAINVEDDSEDEMPVPARRRARLNRT